MTFANLHIIDWGVILFYVVIVLWIGSRFTKKAGKNLTGFFLSGRSLPWWLAGTSVAATHFSVSLPIKTTSMVLEHGISHVWMQWFLIPSTMVGAIFLAKLWRRTKILTSIELLRTRYSGPIVHVLTIFRVIYNGVFIKNFFIAMSFIAIEKMIEIMLPGARPDFIIIGLCIIALLYSVASGLYAVVITDFFQFIFATIGTITLVVIVYINVGPPSVLIQKVTALTSDPTFTSIVPAVPATGAPVADIMKFANFLLFVFVLWMFHGSLTSGGGDPQRMMASRSEKDSMLMLVWSNIVERGLLFWLWIIIALGSIVLLGRNFDRQAAYPAMAIRYLPIGMKGVFIASVFAALMSSIDSNINTQASWMVNDLYKNYIVKNASQRHYVFISRIATVFALCMAFIIWRTLLSGTSILRNFKLVSMLMAGGAFINFCQWFWWRINASAMAAGMLASMVIAYTLRFYLPGHVEWFATYNLATKYWAFGMLTTVIFSTIIGFIVALLTKPTEMERLKEFYRRVQPIGFWGPVKKAVGSTVKHDQFNKSDILTWASVVAGIYCLIFGLGKLLLGSYFTGGLLLVVGFIAIKIMLWNISKRDWWHKKDTEVETL